jgi:predicted nucleic acid-binding protein
VKSIDSSVLVAAALEASPYFEASNRFLETQSPKTCAAAAHALVEAYSVLTRLPAGHRLTPNQAYAVIDNWSRGFKIVALSPDETLKLLEDQSKAGVAGGRIYDAAHARAAAIAGASAIVTWNPKDFAGLEGGLAIETP